MYFVLCIDCHLRFSLLYCVQGAKVSARWSMQVQRAPMEAWYMDDSTEDQRKPHHRDPPEYVSLEKLAGNLRASNTSLVALEGYCCYMLLLTRASNVNALLLRMRFTH